MRPSVYACVTECLPPSFVHCICICIHSEISAAPSEIVEMGGEECANGRGENYLETFSVRNFKTKSWFKLLYNYTMKC